MFCVLPLDHHSSILKMVPSFNGKGYKFQNNGKPITSFSRYEYWMGEQQCGNLFILTLPEMHGDLYLKIAIQTCVEPNVDINLL